MRNSSKGTYYKDPNYEIYVAECDFELEEVDMAEVVSKQPIVYSALSKPVNNNSTIKKQTFEAGKNYIFDITKADQIFDALLAEKTIRLNESHRIPKADDLKGKEYCKWYNSGRHATNNCIIFCTII